MTIGIWIIILGISICTLMIAAAHLKDHEACKPEKKDDE